MTDAVGIGHVEVDKAVGDYLSRSQHDDVSPIRFFDPVWFRSRFAVRGQNAFNSYILTDAQRLAPPSPLFAPRWYCRSYGLHRRQHPLVHFFLNGAAANPHPLFDINYVAQQLPSSNPGSLFLKFLTDPAHFRLKPHPLFDSPWYLNANPDVANAGVNPLEHYLYHGNREGRDPSRLFLLAWYKEKYLNPFRQSHHERIEPLTHYVVRGYGSGCIPFPGGEPLLNPANKITRYGPVLLSRCLATNENIFALMGRLPHIDPPLFSKHLKLFDRFNPRFPDQILFLRKSRVALLISGKAASASVVYWWISQAGLLDFSQRFSSWSHDFELVFRQSREFIGDALTYDPEKYTTYKFVRSPITRALSSFVQLLNFPDAFGVPHDMRSLSFLEFLEMLRKSNFFNQDLHFRPQTTALERARILRPIVLKLEQGLDRHFKLIEAKHGLPPANFENVHEISTVLGGHAKQQLASPIARGPDKKIPFFSVPHYDSLLTPASMSAIYALYRTDFETYGYEIPRC